MNTINTPVFYTISHAQSFVRDIPQDPKEGLTKLFRNAHAIYKMRIANLGNMSQSLNHNDEDALRTGLEILITAKKELRTDK